ncbi:hypothetical protein BGW36DRAFT_394992 [Talaromyces proteolyticus]|uniref:Mmc1 C-terminal domain-containing protein n=1 Tax=Talaromyces proteolyticus TaxID=1131652 RepID=A0AAD4Q452_9EURO|nr:uncharacterized protein BGW36DRAFT_394992 [Talaromyces proteolyticus]KAH8702337.1 hypothetical protein BGW36DRAFT_394992 [Talaromyces proteolyticus]
MPPGIRASVSKSVLRFWDNGTSLPQRVFFCPSCSTWRRTLTTTRTRNGVSDLRRQHDAFTSRFIGKNSSDIARRLISTNSPFETNRTVPARYRDLYALLGELQQTAADQISLSRLQLAQRGLESEIPVIRVAVLGLNDASTARQLVRLLLADPLTGKEPWEDLINSHGSEESQGLLIRYGEESGIIDDSACPTISVSSPLLKKGNIQILVGKIGTGNEPAGVSITEDTLFVPTISISTPNSEVQSVIQYPVHRTIICGTGTDGLFAYSGLLGRANLGLTEQLVHGAIELKDSGRISGESKVTFVDIAVADAALAKFRESVQYASDYERGWTASGIQEIVNWLSMADDTKNGIVLDLEILVQSLLNTAEEGLVAKEAMRIKEQEITTVSADTRQSLDQTVSAWSERAHTELRNSLEEVFTSQRWRGLAWWKLFWRVDDVGAVASEILQTGYLKQAEKEMIWTAGRVKQAGLLNRSPNAEDFIIPSSRAEPEQSAEATEVKKDDPWPMQIAASRFKLSSSTIPSLQALSQNLVLFSASTTGLTSALSALLYTSSSTGLYEACTVAAVGLIYSMRRQQSKWEKARSFWEEEVRETGRTALIETEEVLRKSVRDGPSREREELPETRARLIIERARKALEDVKRG